jgi:hypothetical protein
MISAWIALPLISLPQVGPMNWVLMALVGIPRCVWSEFCTFASWPEVSDSVLVCTCQLAWPPPTVVTCWTYESLPPPPAATAWEIWPCVAPGALKLNTAPPLKSTLKFSPSTIREIALTARMTPEIVYHSR